MRRLGLACSFLCATVALSACGVEGDHAACREVCDKRATCMPSMGDAGWQSCLKTCRAEGRGPDYALCVTSYDCDDAFPNNISLYCDEDPAHPPKNGN